MQYKPFGKVEGVVEAPKPGELAVAIGEYVAFVAYWVF
jgi:hypothetical protein